MGMVRSLAFIFAKKKFHKIIYVDIMNKNNNVMKKKEEYCLSDSLKSSAQFIAISV